MTSTKRFTIAVLFGLGTLLLLASLTSLTMALILKTSNISESSLAVTIFILAIVSMIVAGFVSGMKAKMKGWLAGGMTGITYAFLVFLVNYLGYSEPLSNDNMFYHLGLVAAGSVGGILGVNMTKNE